MMHKSPKHIKKPHEKLKLHLQNYEGRVVELDFTNGGGEERYNRIKLFVSALEFLKDEAERLGDKRVVEIINSAFNMCVITYDLIIDGFDHTYFKPEDD